MKIGILGGLGPEASALFYQQIIKRVQLDNIESNTDYPHIILESIPAPEVLLENPDLSMYKEALKNLEKSGADFIVMVCNTAHVFFDELKSVVGIPLIDLNIETEKILNQNNTKKITIFGSKRSVDKLFRFDNIEIAPISEGVSNNLDKMILEYNAGRNKKELERQFIDLIKKYPHKEVLIACTELSLMIKANGLKYLDTFDILLEATYHRWRAGK